jgi:hypothetical protein
VYRIGNWHREPIPWNPTKLKIDSTQNRASRQSSLCIGVNGLCQNHASRASLPLSSLKGPADHTATRGSPSATTCPRGSSPATTKGSTLINNYRRRFLANHRRNCFSLSLSSSLLSSTIKITPQLNPLSSLLRSTKTCSEIAPQHRVKLPSPPPLLPHQGPLFLSLPIAVCKVLRRGSFFLSSTGAYGDGSSFSAPPCCGWNNYRQQWEGCRYGGEAMCIWQFHHMNHLNMNWYLPCY